MGRSRRDSTPPASRQEAKRTQTKRPYRLIVSDDASKTLGQGEVRYFARIIDAANAFAKAPEPFKQIIYDDGCTARELNRDEEWMLESVCRILGHDVEEVEG